MIIIGISTVGGLGGGIEKVPVIMCLLNYTQKAATNFTYALMFGANFSNFFLLIPQRHPEIDKPIIDYDIALILMPTVLFGSAIGSMLNTILPDIFLLVVWITLCYCLDHDDFDVLFTSWTNKTRETVVCQRLESQYQEAESAGKH